MSIARVQAGGSGATTGAATTIAATLTGVTAGHGLIVLLGGNIPSATTVSGVADGAGNTYTQVAGANPGSTTVLGDVWICKSVGAGGGSLTITATFSQSIGGLMTVIEVSGQDTATFIDQVHSATATSTAPNSGATPATTVANEFVVGMVAQAAAGSAAISAPVFSTALTSQTSETVAYNTTTGDKGDLAVYDGLLASSGVAETFSATAAAKHPWACICATFLPSGGASSTAITGAIAGTGAVAGTVAVVAALSGAIGGTGAISGNVTGQAVGITIGRTVTVGAGAATPISATIGGSGTVGGTAGGTVTVKAQISGTIAGAGAVHGYAAPSSLSPMPKIVVEIAFASNPLGGSYVWVDVTKYARKIQIRRGRQHVLNRFEPGTCSITFNSLDGNLDPTNTGSAYYPNVDINRRIRIRAGSALTPIYTGFVDAWTPQWPNNVSSNVVMTATDGLRLLDKNYFTSSQYVNQVNNVDGAQNLVPFSEATGNIYAVDLSAPSIDDPTDEWFYRGTVNVGTPGQSYVATYTAVTLQQGGYVTGTYDPAGAPRTLTGNGANTMEVWAQWTTTAAYQVIMAEHNLLGGDGSAIVVATGATAGSLYVSQANGNQGVQISGTTATAYNDGNWHHIVVTVDSTGLVYTLYVDGVQGAQLTAAATTFAFGTGTHTTTTDWGLNTSVPWGLYFGGFPGTFPAWVSFQGNIAMGALYPATTLTTTQIATHYALGLTGFVVENAGARMARILTDAGWPAVDQSLQTGSSQIQTPTSPLNTTTVLSYMQQVEDAEHGALFADRSGVIQFQNRYASLTATSQVTLGDATGEVPYKPGPVFALDNIDLYNASHVQRSGGSVQTASNAASVTKYGMTSVLNETGLITTNDSDSLARAQWNVDHFAYPLARMASLTVDVLAQSGANFASVALRELRERVTVNRRPYSTPAGFPASQFSQDNYIEGIEHTIDAKDLTWMTTLRLSPAETRQYWILGNATTGKLDTTTRLAY